MYICQTCIHKQKAKINITNFQQKRASVSLYDHKIILIRKLSISVRSNLPSGSLKDWRYSLIDQECDYNTAQTFHESKRHIKPDQRVP